jgi:hypothetical protein
VTPPHLLPAPPGFPPRQRSAEALETLADQLRQCGIGPLYGTSYGQLGVLSLPGVSVWSNGRLLWWRTADGEVTWPAADAPGAARRLAERSGAPDP